MQFDSFTFLIFFAVVLVGYNALRGWGARKNFLLGASYVFYAAWNPPFLLLLLASTTLDWWIALRNARTSDARARKRWIVATLLVNLVVLGYFKYAGFLLDNLTALLATVGIAYRAPQLGIVLPIGISFYTFHSLSYCLDVYRGKFAPTPSWRDYALYVGFFPQLVAGPIVRWTQIGEQLATPRGTTAHGLGLGLALLTLGLFEKIVLADGVFAPVADGVFNAVGNASAAGAWSGMIAFSGQIFCDFAGYSTCALGAALALGFALPINFRQPYAASGFSDFWRRWHISLSSWLRDYLYVGLGGNRHGEWKTYRNLLLTMLIGGLWHGAAWTFVAWGGLHGAYLMIERFVRERVWATRRDAGSVASEQGRARPRVRAPADAHAPAHDTAPGDAAMVAGTPMRAPLPLRLAYGAITLLAVMYAWVWFRAKDFSGGWMLSGKLVDFGGVAATLAATSFEQRLAAAVFAAVVAVQVATRRHDARALLAKAPKPLLGLLLAAMLVLIVLSPGDNHAFIYFQF